MKTIVDFVLGIVSPLPSRLAAAAAASPRPLAAAPTSRAALPPVDRGADVDARRRGRSRPTSAAARVEKARRLMAEQKIDALMLCGGTSLVYFTNIHWGGGERLFACVIPAKGEPFFVCPAFEEDRAREQIALGPFAGGRRRPHLARAREPVRAGRAGAARTAASPPAGSASRRRSSSCSATASRRPRRGVKIVSGTPVTAGCRMIKDAHELELMRLASAVTLKAYEAPTRRCKEGMTQNDFARLGRRRRTRDSASTAAPACRSASTPRCPHGSIAPQMVREGDDPADRRRLQRRGLPVGHQPHVRARQADGQDEEGLRDRASARRTRRSRPRGPACRAKRWTPRRARSIVDAGYGPDYKYFTHRVGHGMGMDGHEWPYLVQRQQLPLAPGMTFSDEPGIYIRGRVRRAARRRHGDHRGRRGAVHAAVGVAGKAVLTSQS